MELSEVMKHREMAAIELRNEIQKRNEWYGLDNWTPGEVVDFVDDRMREHRDQHALGQITRVGY
jgi:hypothetical protein